MDAIKVRHSGWIELSKISDAPDGDLSVMEVGRDIPFLIRRAYYINNIQNVVSIRGKHAHRTLRQVIFCISGSCILSLDDGETRQDVRLWRDNTGVLLDPGLWHTMHSFTAGCILLVVASDVYEEADYIRDYQEFLRFTRANGREVAGEEQL